MEDTRERVKKILGATNKALSDGGQKDVFRNQMHQALVVSGWRAEMEAKVQELVDQTGNIEDIDVDHLIKTVKGSATLELQGRLEDVRKESTQKMVEHLSEVAQHFISLQNGSVLKPS